MKLALTCVLAGELPEQVSGHLQHPAGLPHLLRPLHLRGSVHLHHPLPGVEQHGGCGRGHNAGSLCGHRGGCGYASPLQEAAGRFNSQTRPDNQRWRFSQRKADGQDLHPVSASCDSILLLQMTMMELTNQLSQPVARNELGEEAPPSLKAEGRRKKKNEDKYGLMDNVVIESLPPMRDEGPRVFIIS